jgi:CubicO group peptidase (beta-lactamase class C family)
MARPAETDLARFLDDELEQGTFPSFQAWVSERGEPVFRRTGGLAVVEPERLEASAETLYDLASLTKPLVTALLTLGLAAEGVLALDLPLSRLVGELCTPGLDTLTALDLLTHRSGLSAWAALGLGFRPGAHPPLQRLVRDIVALPREGEPRSRVVYSDLGYLVLGAALERVTGTALALLWARHIATPLGPLAATGFAFPPRPEDRPRTAATERGNEYERHLAGAQASDPHFRREMLWGEVHDGNAALVSGVAPHAGLFGTAAAVERLAREYLPGGTLVGPVARQLALCDLTAGLGSHRTAAWECATSEGSAGFGVFGDDAVGHSGFTGTSVWLEPSRQRVYVLLTNRVHPAVREVNMTAVRRRFHALARAVEA